MSLFSPKRFLALSVTALALQLAAGPVVAELPDTELLPIEPGDEETRSTPFLAWFQDLPSQGYVEEEFAVSGTANIYSYVNDAAEEADVAVASADVPYVTRILVRRPVPCEDGQHPPACKRFNGTVYVEVLNATAGWDGDPIWQSTHEYMIREGAAWVGISTKPVTVDFLRDGWGRPPWPPRNASRYADLAMPEFGQVWDMLSQIGELLRTRKADNNPLAGYRVRRTVMVGYSQSAGYQVTYANSFHDSARMPDGGPVYDGYYISAGGSSAKHVTGPTASTPESLPLGDARNLTVVDAPVIRFQTQTEVVNFPSFPVRQTEDDYPMLRFYEMAGGSHVDAQLNAVGGQALVRDLGLPPSFCPAPAIPYNPIRIGYVQSALMESMERWIRWGFVPPDSRFMDLTLDSGATQIALDGDGNATGGVRPPNLEAPLGTYVESNTGPGFCFLFGGFAPFDQERLDELYPFKFSYYHALNDAIRQSRRDGFLLREDALAIRREAKEMLMD